MDATKETGDDPAGAQSRGAEGGTNLSVGLGGSPTADECIELAVALERQRANKIVEAVMELPIGGATAVMPTPFQSGYQLACDEITYRLKNEEWGIHLPPNK